MSLRLKINRKLDEKLVEQFQEDPYADLTIILQHTNIRLSLAYLSLDSQWFADLTPNTSSVDLSKFDEEAALAVLKSLYGGPLQCSSPSDFELLWPVISFLQINEYAKAAEEEVKNWLEKRDGGPGSLDWVEVCLKSGFLREWMVDWLSSQHLKMLQSTKNYLQLGKLSDESLNYLLLQYLRREPEKTTVVNTILQNYFNRKGQSPSIYFQRPDLAPLKEIWEKHHHRFRGTKLDKITSIHSLIATAVTSPRGREEESKTATVRTKAVLGGLNCVSLNLTGDVFKTNKMTDQMLDVRLSVLANELQQKNRKIHLLQDELQQLQDLKGKRIQEDQTLNEETMLDIVLLKNRMKSKREKHLNQEPLNEYALDNPCRRVIEQEKTKVPSSKGSMKKL